MGNKFYFTSFLVEKKATTLKSSDEIWVFTIIWCFCYLLSTFILQSEGKTQTEAMYINKSLTFLEQVVVALADRRREHIPFRQSKLTHCLKDSIGGRSNTLLIANVWGERSQIEETVSILLSWPYLFVDISPVIGIVLNI